MGPVSLSMAGGQQKALEGPAHCFQQNLLGVRPAELRPRLGQQAWILGLEAAVARSLHLFD